jgi:hypothetical protein
VVEKCVRKRRGIDDATHELLLLDWLRHVPPTESGAAAWSVTSAGV